VVYISWYHGRLRIGFLFYDISCQLDVSPFTAQVMAFQTSAEVMIAEGL
jgi:hypothetical protein